MAALLEILELDLSQIKQDFKVPEILTSQVRCAASNSPHRDREL